MTVRIGINGFGRIGRNAARIILSHERVALAAINSHSSAESHAYLLTHDSVYGAFPRPIVASGNVLVSGKTRIVCFQKDDPADIPWSDAGVDVVLECTGKFRTTNDAGRHLTGSVRKVIISAPATDATPTYVMGVNHGNYKGERVVSNSSCTTNCVAAVLAALDDAFGVNSGFMTTVHAATDSQNLLDNSHKKDVRLRRSALVNLIPTTSGSAKDVAKLFPHLAGKLPCRAIRVPTPTVSLIDLVVSVREKTDRNEVNRAFERAASANLKGILSVASEELVSSDYIGSVYSSVVDPFLTDVVEDHFVHVTAWYDNEWGYANRLVELATSIFTST